MIDISAKKISSIFLAIAAVLSLSVMTWSIIANDKTYSGQEVAATTEQIEKYVLKDYNGFLAVFVNDDSVPIEKFDVSVSTFTEYDKSLLQYGIEVKTKEQLDKLIEDYTS